jgi:DNA-binding transcriptional ArsR family regulator
MTPDEEEARTIARAMASSTAGQILRSFQGSERTASDLGTALNIPIPTVMYHLDALLDAGLIEVSRIRYSVKGREVKVYRQSDQVFIVAPRQADIRQVLLKYASLFGLTILGSGIASILSGVVMSGGIPPAVHVGGAEEKSMPVSVAKNTADMIADRAAELPSLSSMAPPPSPGSAGFLIPDIAIGIIIGGCLIIGALICLDIISRRKKR